MAGPASITTVLLDFDGVVRLFDPDHVTRVEAAHGLRVGALTEAAFTPSLLQPAITGQVTRQEWIHNIGDLVGNHDAATEWMADRGTVDADVLDIVDELRTNGTTVAVLTNGTDTIPQEIVELGLHDRFDAVFSTYFIGYAKPDVRAFEHVCEVLNVDAASVFFTDDSPSKLTGAIELGMTTAAYQAPADLRHQLHELQLL